MQTSTLGGFQQQQQQSSGTTPSSANITSYGAKPVSGGRFDFDDGGTYCGGWEDGKAHGHGVCTGPKGQGEYSGSWHFGFEVSGVYMWPSGSTFEGQWQNGKRHGLGMEYRGRWTYRGEWTQGFKGRYGVRQATASSAKYEGTWANGLQDGYGSEAYADGGTYQGQWLRGLRHGYGVRTSAPFGMASHLRPKAPSGSMVSLKSESAADPTSERDRRMDDVRGGFVLKARSDDPPGRRQSLVEKSSNIKESILKGLKLRKQRSTGDLDKKGVTTSIRSTVSSSSWMSNESGQSGVTTGSCRTDSNASFVVEDEHMDTNVTETYMGEWKNDKRSGFGISERTDGLKYEGEWYNNKKYGYGVTTMKDGVKEEGKYKNNLLITSQKKKHLFLMRSAKFRERVDAAVNAAQRASKIALQKADIAISRTATARGKSEHAEIAATHSREDSELARLIAKKFAPDFHQPGTEITKHQPSGVHQQEPDVKAKNFQNNLREGTGGMPVGNTTRQRGEPEMPVDARYDTQATPYDQHNISAYNNSVLDNHDSDDATSQSQLPQTPHSRLDATFRRSSSQYMNSSETPANGMMYNQNSPSQNRVNDFQRLVGQKLLVGNNIMAHSSAGDGRETLRDVMGNQVMSNSQNVNYNNQGFPAAHSQNFPYPGNTECSAGYDNQGTTLRERGRETIRRSSHIQRPNTSTPSSYNYQQAMSDHFDHYKRPPSRDRESSRDRSSRARSVTRAQTPEISHENYARPQSRQRTPFSEQRMSPSASQNPIKSSNTNLDLINRERNTETPSRHLAMGSSGHDGVGNFSGPSSDFCNPHLDNVILRQQGLGQEILPSVYTPKRTESMFLKPVVPNTPTSLNFIPASSKMGVTGVPLKRKKSLPDAASLPKATPGMSREEISELGSARRQALHRILDDAERKRANPLLHLLNPNFNNWFSRQKLMVIVLVVNLFLAMMFLQLLT